MNVTPINNQPSFNSKIITKGKWPKVLRNAVQESEAFKNLAKGEYDIYTSLSTKTALAHDFNHTFGEDLYKLKISAKKSEPKFIDKVKNCFGLNPRCTVNKNYHSLYGMEEIISGKLSDGFLKNKLGI